MTERDRVDVGGARALRRHDTSGMHVRCAEAQADGVPCGELRTDCDVCMLGLLAVWRKGRWELLPAAAGTVPDPSAQAS